MKNILTSYSTDSTTANKNRFVTEGVSDTGGYGRITGIVEAGKIVLDRIDVGRVDPESQVAILAGTKEAAHRLGAAAITGNLPDTAITAAQAAFGPDAVSFQTAKDEQTTINVLHYVVSQA